MDTQGIVTALFQRRRLGIKPGLSRMHSALEMLGMPQNDYKVVHIAGTNGKGSTAAMMSSILSATGATVGLFTSPHIVLFRERFCINNQPVEDAVWLPVWLEIEPIADALELTFFEISALIAFRLFQKEKCEWVVLETGLGGRLDATNVVTAPALTMITALSVEHTEYLGDTIELIAQEKLGIVKPQVPCVFHSQNPSSTIKLARDMCRQKESPLLLTHPELVSYNEATAEVSAVVGGERVTLSLRGSFQRYNLAGVLEACKILMIPHDAITKGLQSTFLPGRFQLVQYQGREIIFDVAHNPQALEELSLIMNHRYPDKKHTLVIGMMADKEVQKSLQAIASSVGEIVATAPQTDRALSAETLCTYAREVASSVIMKESVEEAIRYALTKKEPILVTGSFFMVSEAMLALSIEPYAQAV